jgi:hypothetical protein
MIETREGKERRERREGEQLRRVQGVYDTANREVGTASNIRWNEAHERFRYVFPVILVRWYPEFSTSKSRSFQSVLFARMFALTRNAIVTQVYPEVGTECGIQHVSGRKRSPRPIHGSTRVSHVDTGAIT